MSSPLEPAGLEVDTSQPYGGYSQCSERLAIADRTSGRQHGGTEGAVHAYELPTALEAAGLSGHETAPGGSAIVSANPSISPRHRRPATMWGPAVTGTR